MGGMRLDWEITGSLKGPEGRRVPNITLHKPKGIAAWGLNDIPDGRVLPDGDYVGGAMIEAIKNSTNRIAEEGLRTIVTFLSSTPKHQGP